MDANSSNVWGRWDAPETLTPADSTGPITIRVGRGQKEIADALAVRDVVFIREQNVPVELEHDEYDNEALHLLAINTATDETVGTARILNKGNGVAKIGRVAVLKEYRGRGIGDALMRAALDASAASNFSALILEAQVAVIPFYEKLGFVAEGDVFDDAGIPHRRMSRAL